MSGKFEMVRLRCPICGNEPVIWRKKSRLKEKGHVKHLWCPVCKESLPHVEVRENG